MMMYTEWLHAWFRVAFLTSARKMEKLEVIVQVVDVLLEVVMAIEVAEQ